MADHVIASYINNNSRVYNYIFNPHPSNSIDPSAYGASFLGDNSIVKSVGFIVSRLGSLGNVFFTAAIYAASGTFGDSADTPTGQPLAESDPIAFNNITNSGLQWTTFTFPSGFKAVSGQHYWVVIKCNNAGLDLDHCLLVGSWGVGAVGEVNVNCGSSKVFRNSLWQSWMSASLTQMVFVEVVGEHFYEVTYDGNGATSGSVPVDGSSPYVGGSFVMVLGNSGGLVKTNCTFLGWSPSNSALVPTYGSGSLFIISANTTLYAVWGSNSGGGGGGFDGGVINSSLEVNCKFPYLASMSEINSWMSALPGALPDYSAFLRFTNVAVGDPALSTDMYGIIFKDDTNTDAAAIGINDSLFVRKDLFTRGFIHSAKDILPLEKWVNNTPAPSNPENKVLDVNLGSADWPFDHIYSRYGHIGNLEVPAELKTDYIKSLTNVDLTIKPWAGKKIKLDGDVQITGTLTGGGGNGGTFDGGTIDLPLEIKHVFPQFANLNSMRDWMYNDNDNTPAGLSDNPLGLRFSEMPEGYWTDIYGVIVGDPAFPSIPVAPSVATNYHLLVRKDFYARGKLCSYEGNIVLRGNGFGAIGPGNPGGPNDAWNVGWGPRTGTPFVWLAEGGDYVNGQGGNQDAETLLIVTNNQGDPDKLNYVPAPPEIPGTPGWDVGMYRWGHLEAGNIISHGFLKTSHLKRADSSGFIALYNSMEPNGSNINLGSSDRKFNDIFCGGILYTSHLQRASATGFIALYNSIEPNGSLINLGSSSREFENLYVKNLHVSGTGGGSANIQKGSATTDANGNFSVTFSSAFSSAPYVTCTARDSQGRAISIVIISKSSTGFSVKSLLASSTTHTHKVAESEITATFNMAVDSGGSHDHSVQGSTNSTNASHNHGLSGGVSNESSHTHGITHSNSSMDTGYTSAGGTSHRHSYVEYFVSNNVTGSGSSHSHGNTLSVDSASVSHSHTFAQAQTSMHNGHTHGFTNKPLYVRGVTLFNQGGGGFGLGALFQSLPDSVRTDLYTLSGGSVTATPVAVTFDWIAIA